MPEVQAHAERMTAALGGATLEKFELLNFAALKTFDPPADAVGASICCSASAPISPTWCT